jgi:hypothetical protein
LFRGRRRFYTPLASFTDQCPLRVVVLLLLTGLLRSKPPRLVTPVVGSCIPLNFKALPLARFDDSLDGCFEPVTVTNGRGKAEALERGRGRLVGKVFEKSFERTKTFLKVGARLKRPLCKVEEHVDALRICKVEAEGARTGKAYVWVVDEAELRNRHTRYNVAQTATNGIVLVDFQRRE